jgi:hypothetical protein
MNQSSLDLNLSIKKIKYQKNPPAGVADPDGRRGFLGCIG